MFGNLFSAAGRFLEEQKKKVQPVVRAVQKKAQQFFTKPITAPILRKDVRPQPVVAPRPVIKAPVPTPRPAPARPAAVPVARKPTQPTPGLVSAAQRLFGGVADTAKKFVGIQSPFTPMGTTSYMAEKAGQALQKFPDTTIRLPEKKIQIGNQKNVGFTPEARGITSFITGLPKQIAKETGFALEKSATPQGRKELFTGAKQIPTQIRNRDVGALFENPATVALFGLSNVIPGGGIVPSLVKKGVKQTVKTGVKEVVKKEAPQLFKGTKPLAEEAEIKRVGNNILKNNQGITLKDAEAMAKDVIENRKFTQAAGGIKPTLFKGAVKEPTKKAETLFAKETPVPVKPAILFRGIEPPKPISVIEDIKGGFEGGRKARETVEATAKGTLAQRAKTQLVDRLTPVFDFVNKAAKQLPTEQNPYRKMRLLAGVSGKVEAFLERNIAPVLRAEKTRQPDLAALMVLDREKELVGRGLVRKRTAEQIEQGYQELINKHGQEGFATLRNSAAQLRKAGDEMLDMLHEAGVIDDASYNAIKKNNQFYAPMEAVEHIADSLEKGRFANGSFNVASQDVIRRIGSYTGDVADPIEALLRKIPKVIALTEKNKAVQSLVNLRKEYADVYSDLIVPIKGGKVPEGMGSISVFEKGKNVNYAVPEVVESAVKNLDRETANILVSVGAFQAKILRAGATGLNIAFIPVNIARDVQDALITELTERGAKAMFQFLGSYPRAIFSAAKKDDLYLKWAEAGGLQSTMTEQIFKRTPKTLAELSGKVDVIRTIINSPKSLVEFANRVGEQSTRLARFKSGVARGETAAEAAFKSRDISLDFAKAGDKIKVLNQIIPFLNAGIQGSEKLMRLYKNNPKAAIASTGILFGIPTIALYTYNSQFKDFDDIPDAERQTNWIIIARDRTEEEIADGEKIVGIKIPKGFLGRMVANTLDSSMDFMRSGDPSTFTQSAVDTLGGISPVGVTPTQIASTITPPWLQAGIETITNTDLYYGSRIVPRSLEGVEPSQQYKKTTPEIYKLAGKAGVSPLHLENIINSISGGLGRQAGALFSGDVEGATVEPIARRFLGIRGGEENSKYYDEIDRVARTKATLKKTDTERIMPIYEQVQALDKAGRKAEALELVSKKKMSDEDYEIYKSIKQSEATKTGNILEKQMYSTVKQFEQLYLEGRGEEAKQIAKDMTDEEYKAYKAAKKALGFPEEGFVREATQPQQVFAQ